MAVPLKYIEFIFFCGDFKNIYFGSADVVYPKTNYF